MMKLNNISSVKVESKKKTFSSIIQKNKYLILLILPGMAYFVIFKFIPMIGLLMAFQNYSIRGGLFGSPWVGLKQFELLFSGNDFIKVLFNTLNISFWKIIVSFPAPILLALMLNEVRKGVFKKVTQTISYLPHFLSWVVLSGMIVTILSPSQGMINSIIQACGGTPIYFLADQNWFVSVLIISDTWKEIGWSCVIYLAALSGMNVEVNEAATIDGATRMQKIKYLNLPFLFQIAAIMFIIRMGGILNAGFDQIFNLYTPPVYDISDIIDTYTYRMGISGFQYSFATATGLFKSVIGFILVMLTNKLTKTLSGGEVSL